MFIAPPPGLAPPGLSLPEGAEARASLFLHAEHARLMQQYMQQQQAKLAWENAVLREQLKMHNMTPATWQSATAANAKPVSLKPPGCIYESPVSTEPPSDNEDEEVSEDEKVMYQDDAANHTTVLMRNVPRCYSRKSLTDLLDSEGFSCKYSFIYLPFNFGKGTTLGYAFVNLVSNSVTESFLEHFQGFTDWGVSSNQTCNVERTNDQQGLAANIDRYRNSPVMHDLVPEVCKPLILKNGVQVVFPPPTVAIRHPPRRLLLGNLARQS